MRWEQRGNLLAECDAERAQFMCSFGAGHNEVDDQRLKVAMVLVKLRHAIDFKAKRISHVLTAALKVAHIFP